MAFWKENTAQPKRKFRFQVQFGNTSGNAVKATDQSYWWAKTIKVPSFTLESAEHHYLDNKYNFPGRVTWEDVEMTLVDPSAPDATQIIMELLALSGYSVKGENDTPETIGKQAAAKNTNCVITTLDEAGIIIETWTLQNCFIVGANLGDYDYSSDDLRELSLTLKYDWATCEVGGVTYNPTAAQTGNGIPPVPAGRT